MCIVIMLPRRCDLIKVMLFIHAIRVVLGQLFLTSLAKQFTTPPIISVMKLENLAIGHCDVTIASDRLVYR